MDEIRDKVVVLTGASRGIGAAAARDFAAMGAKLVLVARSGADISALADEITASDGAAIARTGDVTVFADMEAAIGTALAQFGRIDVLVNNAGVIEPIARLGESDPDAWSHAADINYKGVYNGLRAAIPPMAEQGAGVIVNVSSGAAVSPLEGWSHYCSSKAAALMLTRCADAEYRDAGIRVVGMSPGTVATDMQVRIKASGINPVSQLDPAVHIPADWAARAIVWLCTEAAADFAGTDLSLRDETNRRRIGLIE